MPLHRVAAAVMLLLAVLPAATLRSQSPAKADQTYTSAATAVLVDVVVRDRKGQLVTDLSAEDFELLEDGVVQKVDTFSRVTRGGGIAVGVAWRSPANTTNVVTARPVDPAAPAPPAEGAVALVFDHLSPESLRLAQRATLDYVPLSGESGLRVGVFATHPGLRMLQRYTTDRTVVRQAVSRVLPGSTSDAERLNRAEELRARRRDLEGDTASAISTVSSQGGNAAASGAANIGGRETELRLVQTELNMLRSFESMERDHRGHDISSALMRVVETLAFLPGRKTIVFFSEGLPISPAVSAQLDAVIDAANRANVTTYAIDANGLRTRTSTERLKQEVNGFVEDRFSQLAVSSDRTNQPLTMAFERVEDTLRLDNRAGLARLAEDTGGFLVEQSNDLSAAFRRIDEDNQFHYLLTYSPRNSTFDGKYRTIRVKVRKPSTQVFARRGYRAIRSGDSTDLASFERPALAILDGPGLPNAFPVHAAGFSFPDPARPGLTPLLVHVHTSALHFAVDERKSTYSSRAAIVVRVKDGSGQEVHRLSQRYTLAGDARDIDRARQGDILFYREVDLEPGLYTVESVVFDAAAQRGSARVATLSVPATGGRDTVMSSLVLVNRIEETPDAGSTPTAPPPPLYVGRALLYPNLGEAISKAAVKELPFYFALYGDATSARISARLLRNGQTLAEAPVTVRATGGTRVQHVGKLPVAALPSGIYELRIVVEGAKGQVSRAAFFTLTD